MKGRIIKIQRFSIQDGPGIRTTIFLKGCPLKCLWCSNPESQSLNPEIMFNKAKCIQGCNECIKACPVKAIIKKDSFISINREKCIGCEDCVKACPSEALTFIGKLIEAKQVIEEIKKDKAFYEKSNGGITISGGEPLFQAKFTKEILKLCKKEGMHTALDTSGYGDWKKIKEILKYTDLVLYDLKHMDPFMHIKYTGVSNEIILKNALKISKEKVDLRIRVPIIPTINDSMDNLAKLAKFIKKLERIEEIDFLPYHRLGISKYEMLDKEYPLKSLQPPSKEYLLKLKNYLETYGIKVNVLTS